MTETTGVPKLTKGHAVMLIGLYLAFAAVLIITTGIFSDFKIPADVLRR